MKRTRLNILFIILCIVILFSLLGNITYLESFKTDNSIYNIFRKSFFDFIPKSPRKLPKRQEKSPHTLPKRPRMP